MGVTSLAPEMVYLGLSPRDVAGYAVSFAGDMNDDGLEDMLVGAPDESSAADGAGAAYLVFGLPR